MLAKLGLNSFHGDPNYKSVHNILELCNVLLQVKWYLISSILIIVHKLSNEFPNDLGTFVNQKILEKSINWTETEPSAQLATRGKILLIAVKNYAKTGANIFCCCPVLLVSLLRSKYFIRDHRRKSTRYIGAKFSYYLKNSY